VGEDTFESNAEQQPAGRWRGVLTWTGLLTAALILYELTRQPALGVVTLCLKFGWEDFKTANWLARVDPWRERARACWWAYLGSGIWRSASVAFLTNLAIIAGIVAFAIAGVQRQALGAGGDRLISSFLGAAGTTVVGYALAGFSAAVGVAIARRNAIRLWLDGSVNVARRYGVWPPPESRKAHRNNLLLILVTTTFPVALVVMGAEYDFLLRWHFQYAGVVLMFTGLLISLFAFACFGFGRSVEAHTIEQCWPPDELPPEPRDPVQ
jgi:hypothetical protein